MSNEKAKPILFTFENYVRAGFLHVITPQQFNGKGDPRYDGSFIVPKDSPDLVKLKALCLPLLQELHPGKKIVPRRLTQEELDAGNTVEVSVPWRDGTKEADRAKANGKDQEFFRGNVCVKVGTKYPPALSAIENGEVTAFADDATVRASLTRLFYPGAYFFPCVQLHSYKANGTDGKPGGVSLWLPGILFAKHGKRIGTGELNSAEVFKGYAGKVVEEDPTAGAETTAAEEF